MEHYVAPDRYDPEAERQVLDRADLDAPTWVLVWRRFRRHKLGVACFLFLAIGYAILPFVEVIAPYRPNDFNVEHVYAPPQGLYLFHQGSYVGLHTHPTSTVFDEATLLVRKVEDQETILPVPVLTTCGAPYTLLGVIESRFRMICPPEEGHLFLMGSDR
ncbi:MAG: ABC transporter permease, partial [Pseudomonadota bacterium]